MTAWRRKSSTSRPDTNNKKGETVSDPTEQGVWQWAATLVVGWLAALGLRGLNQNEKKIGEMDRHMEAIDQAHEDHKLHVAQTYVPYTVMRERINEVIVPITKALERIENKIDASMNRELESKKRSP